MSLHASVFRWKPKPRETRLMVCLTVVLMMAAWRYLPRPWYPTLIVEAPHHKVYSTATALETSNTVHALELLYTAYSNRLSNVNGWQRGHPKLQAKLYKDRDELRRVNPGLGWAEAFYSEPFCRAYYSGAEINPYHWMLHESVHQLNHEVAHLKLAKWLEEGLADYFGTSRLSANQLIVGWIDQNTYPVWWLDDLASSPNLKDNLTNGSVIPLRAIITNAGGPSMEDHFNLYYLHWWTLTYFLFESEKYRNHILPLVQKGGELNDFETLIGPVEKVQDEWHDYVHRMKAALAGKDRELFKSKKIPQPPEPPNNSHNRP